MPGGFRPEPIAIPAGSFAINPSLELPVSTSGACYDGAVSSEATDGGASSSCLGTSSSTVATSIIEPLEQADLAFGVSEIHHADLKVLHNIGHGSSGVVQKVLHTPSDSVLALKIIPVEADETKRKQILLELKTLHESMHESIVSFYGAFFREGAVHVCLEYMDASLLDVARSEGCALPEPVLAGITRPVLQGLVYLHRERHMIHRDIKPANVLVDVNGHVKLADFGVSGELGHTLAKCASWVGTVHYMSPERIQGSCYSYDSDVWSLGITLLELGNGAFPYPPERGGRRLSFWDLLDAIVESPPPTPPAHFGAPFHNFITACLQKEPSARASSSQLLGHPMLQVGLPAPGDVADWIRGAIARMPPRGSAGRNGEGEGEGPSGVGADGATAQSLFALMSASSGGLAGTLRSGAAPSVLPAMPDADGDERMGDACYTPAGAPVPQMQLPWAR